MTPSRQDVQVEKKKSESDIELKEDQPVFVPPTDIYEKPDSILVVCDMPGVDEKHVDISLEQNVLTLTGYQDREELDNRHAVHKGYHSGIYQRSFTLSTDIEEEKIEAKIAQGVLTIVLPKSKKVQPRKIKVESAN